MAGTGEANMAVAVAEQIPPPVVLVRRNIISVLLENRKFVWGAAVFLAIGLTAIVGGLVVDPEQRRTGAYTQKLAPSTDSAGLILGTTTLGQSVSIQWTEAV